MWLASRGERWPETSISAISDEPPPMSNSTTPSVSRSTSEPQPETASRASVSRSMISRSSPASALTRARNSSPLAAERQASVAISRERRIERLASLSAQIFSASTARSMAGWPRRPLADSPSPSRTMREKASMTRNWPGRVGTATSSRQLLVPRSSAANTGSSSNCGQARLWRGDGRPRIDRVMLDSRRSVDRPAQRRRLQACPAALVLLRQQRRRAQKPCGRAGACAASWAAACCRERCALPGSRPQPARTRPQRQALFRHWPAGGRQTHRRTARRRCRGLPPLFLHAPREPCRTLQAL